MTDPGFGRYQVVRELGRGAMAIVYLAEDTVLKRQVALKAINPQYAADPDFRSRFEREALIMARVRHDSIVPVFDFGERAGQQYIVMDYMPGGTLEDRLRRGRLPTGVALAILRRVARALDAAHAAGVIHRDLKPANILFDAQGRSYVGDFGVGRMDGSSTGVTMPGTVVGTAHYMSPEQVRGADPTPAADIYSFGALAFETLTGRPPYEGESAWDVMRQHVESLPPRTSRYDMGLQFADDPVADAMAKDPARRPRQAIHVVEALEQGYGGAPAPVRATSSPERTVVAAQMGPSTRPPIIMPPAPATAYAPPPAAAPNKTRWIVLGVAGAVVVAVVAGVALSLSGGDGPKQVIGDETPATRQPTQPRAPTATPTKAPPTATPPTLRTPTGNVILSEGFDGPGAPLLTPFNVSSGRAFVDAGAFVMEDYSDADNLFPFKSYDVGAGNQSISADVSSASAIVYFFCRVDDNYEVRLIIDQAKRSFKTQIRAYREDTFSTYVDWTVSPQLHDSGPNRIDLICRGQQLEAVINGVLVASHTIAGAVGTKVGLGVDGGSQASFDNIEIRAN
ncbi:MAG: protein kinase [Dehalococcoidia bacterium]|nr:protein kinase [Dehalococcoidia bacterium]MCB9486069.1 protein kinase [Thermoflexaceae bacterium]